MNQENPIYTAFISFPRYNGVKCIGWGDGGLGGYVAVVSESQTEPREQ